MDINDNTSTMMEKTSNTTESAYSDTSKQTIQTTSITISNKERVSYWIQILVIKLFKTDTKDVNDKDEEDRTILKALLVVTGLIYE